MMLFAYFKKMIRKGMDRVKRWSRFLIPAAFLGTVLFPLAIHSAEEPFLKRAEERNIGFLSGGIGQREREILQKMGKGYPLKMVFTNRKGEYLSDVVVKIFDLKGDLILTTVSNGPWLFVDLPSGIYSLEASLKADQKRVSQIKIEKGSQKVVSIQWSSGNERTE